MSKFKIGDRVKIIDDRGSTKAEGRIGNIGTVVGLTSHDSLTSVSMADGEIIQMYAYRFQPAITLTTGKFYRTASGAVTSRVTKGDTGFEAVVDGKVRIFDAAGGAVHGGDDIVEEWVPKVGERVRFTNECDTDWWFGPTTKHKEGIVSGPATCHKEYQFDVAVSGEPYPAHVDIDHIEPLPVATPAHHAAPVSAQVDAIAEEYGAATRETAVVASNDNAAKPKFKVGDRVVFRNYSGSEHCYGTVEDVSVDGKRVLASDWSIGAEVGYLPVADLELADTEPDTTRHIKFTSDFSELDAAILVRKKKLKKLIKLARKAGIELREAA